MQENISISDRNPTLQSLQIIRGLTALSIAAIHTSIIMAKPQYGAVQAFVWQTSRCWMGVNLFFVLSGFIIFFAHGKDIGKPERLPIYAWRRLCRVYPVYWIFLTAFICVALAGFGYRSFRLTWGDMMSAYTLVHWVDDPTLPLKVAWTLVFEVSFYAMFAALVVNRHLGLFVFGLWLAAILIASFGLGSLAMGWMSMWNINFFVGAAAFWLFKRLDDRWGLLMLGSGIALLAVLIAWHPGYSSIEIQQSQPGWLMILGLPFGLLLLGAALAERRYRFSAPRLLTLLGEASFATYLIHSAVISALCPLLHRHAAGLVSPQAAFGLILVSAMLAGLLAHFFVERPVMDLVKRVSASRGGGSHRSKLTGTTVPAV